MQIKRNRWQAVLFACGLVTIGLAISLSGITGDLMLFLRFIFLNKIHLSKDFIFPHFTPGHCGGFLLGGDPQNPIFTIYQVFGLLYQNQFRAVQAGTAIATVLFGWGYYRWLPYLGANSTANSRTARMLSTLLLCVSGWWVIHLKIGHLTFHSIAYLPWLFIEIEKLFNFSHLNQTFVERAARIMTRLLSLGLILFLLINAGQIWFQFVFLYLLGRLVVEGLNRIRARTPFNLSSAILTASSAGLLAVGLSAIKMSATYEFVLKNFSRNVPISQLVASGRYLIQIVTQAFFDHRIITQHLDEKHLGGWWEWSAYVGVVSLLIAVLGLNRVKSSLTKYRPIQALILACVLQLIFCRYSEVVELYRTLIPPTRTMTFYFRGIILLVFLYGIFVAHGFEKLLEKRYGLSASLFLFAAALVELTSVYSLGGLMSPSISKVYAEATYQIPEQISGYLASDAPDINYLNAISAGTPTLACYNPPLLGYAGHAYLTQVQPGLVFSLRESTKLNMNDIEEIFLGSVPGGHFQKQLWPLWKKDDDARLQDFVKFKQVFPAPMIVRAGKYVTYFSLLVLLCLIGITMKLKQVINRTRITPPSTQQT